MMPAARPRPKVPRIITVIVAAAAVAAAGCGSHASGNTKADTAPGITAKQITVANISVLTGPVPGLFEGAPFGVEAYFAYINSKGGVAGRKLSLTSLDDGFSCTTNESLMQSNVTQVFAFVGQTSIFDNCGETILAKHRDVPDVSFTFDPTTAGLSNEYSPVPYLRGFATGSLEYIKQKYPGAITKVGTLVGNNASSIATWDYQQAAMQSLGYKFIYKQLVPSALSTALLTPDIVRMKAAGVQIVALTAVNDTGVADFLNAAQQQGWHPKLVTNTGTAYDSAFLKTLNAGAGSNLLIAQNVALFRGEDKTDPGVSLFLHWMHKVHPSFSPDIWSLYSWASAALFVQALQAAGPAPTQAGLVRALRAIHSFNADGLIAPSNPGAKTAAHCYLLVKLVNGNFTRTGDPATGFRCDGKLHMGSAS
jgi:ABC-type branched-subunit amino acid transport system substrate-binding protein